MLNNVCFQGRMVRDVELKETQGGIKYANFTLAWSEKYKETEIKCFIRCKAWRQAAEFVDKYFHAKGSEVVVEGRLETEEWEKDGQKQSMVVLNVSHAHFCGKKAENAQTAPGGTQTSAEPPAPGFTPADDDDLPF